VLKYDIHIHTDSSSCSGQKAEEVVRKAESLGLDGIAITNHNEVSDIQVAREESDELDVISGTEVTTNSGDVLGLFVENCPQSDDAIEVIKDIHEQNGVAILAHPMDFLRNSYDEENHNVVNSVDAIEVVNSRCLVNIFNKRAKKLSQEHNKPCTAGSDAHFPFEIGRASITVNSKSDIPENIKSIEGRGMYLSGHIATKIHKFRNGST
jgi:predicted metal-dependent phosphoesterase TrpH